jgi:hypothetical protein
MSIYKANPSQLEIPKILTENLIFFYKNVIIYLAWDPYLALPPPSNKPPAQN